mmetsp:Transcript_104655/g.291513  ORF Transcript_104655/g.291513 Transcript_104655/m.291513 type:complete len:187 (+) Transcript_104655:48-608(+)
MSTTRLAAVLVLCGVVPARLGLRLQQAAQKASRTVERDGKRWLGYPQDPEMDQAYYEARDNTWPQLVHDDDPDYLWYKDYYMYDKNNSLEDLSLTSDATEPSEERLAADNAKERSAFEAVRPMLAAEEAEADHYYSNIFPLDSDNDLEEFSYGRGNSSESVEESVVNASVPTIAGATYITNATDLE